MQIMEIFTLANTLHRIILTLFSRNSPDFVNHRHLKDWIFRGNCIIYDLIHPFISTNMFKTILSLLLFSSSLIAAKTPEYPVLEIGKKAPDWALKGIDGKTHKLSDYNDKDVLMIVFTSNHCPDAQAAEEALIQLVKDYKDKSFAMVAISGNHPNSLRLDELRFSIHGDSYEDMIAHAKEYGFNFPYLYDGDDQKTTMAYGARSTPHVFIFDKSRTLRYNGRIDDSRNGEPANSHEARNAIDALLAGKEVTVPITRSFGCSTKWLYKKDAVAEDNAKWESKPVGLDLIDQKGVAELVANQGEELRLINVWATWCGPCVSEMPELVEIYRMYQNRPFEFISISIDEPKYKKEALNVLEDNHAAIGIYSERLAKKGGRKTNNFIWNGKNLDTLAETLDSKWPGPIPYTILVAPGGEVIYRHSGEIVSEDVRRAIVKYLGRWRS